MLSQLSGTYFHPWIAGIISLAAILGLLYDTFLSDTTALFAQPHDTGIYKTFLHREDNERQLGEPFGRLKMVVLSLLCK